LVAGSPPPERPSLIPAPDDHSPEPLAVATDAEVEMPLPSNPQTFFLGGIFALSVFATLHLASSVILPVVLAFVLQLLLQPAVRLLERVAHLPRVVGALLTVLSAISALVGVVAGLSVPAAKLGDEVAGAHTSFGSPPGGFSKIPSWRCKRSSNRPRTLRTILHGKVPA
jgi:hypothetical protein